MAKDGVKSLESSLSAATTWVVDEANAVRESVLEGVYKAERVIHGGAVDVQRLWALS